MRINEQQILQAGRSSVSGAADELVLTDLITAAKEALQDAIEVEQTASAAVTKADDDLKKANLASYKAAHTPGGDVMTAELAVEQAERSARVAGKILVGATNNRKVADEALQRAIGEAWMPVAREGAKRLVDALEQVEKVRAALDAAFVAVRAGEDLLRQARQNGSQFRIDHAAGLNRWLVDGNGDICLTTAENERRHWVAAGLLSAEG